MPPSKLRTLYSPRRFIPDNQDSPPRTFASLEEILIPFSPPPPREEVTRRLREMYMYHAAEMTHDTISSEVINARTFVSSNDGKRGQMNLAHYRRPS